MAKIRRKKSNNPAVLLAQKQKRRERWRETMSFLFKNTAIATQQYMEFEMENFKEFQSFLTGHERCLRDLAVIANRIKYAELPAKPAPTTLKEFNAMKPKKLTKKQKIKEAKLPSFKPLPKPNLENVLSAPRTTESIEKYLDIIDRLSSLSKMAFDFNNSIEKFPETCLQEQSSDQNGNENIVSSSTVSDISNSGERLISYWRGLTTNKTFPVMECGSVNFHMPIVLSQEQENLLMTEKWKHLARTVLGLAQKFIQYASKKTGIIINSNQHELEMKIGLSADQLEVMDELTKVILITPVTKKQLSEAEILLQKMSNIGVKISSDVTTSNLPGCSDELTLHLPDEPPKITTAKKKRIKKKNYSITKKSK